jgi:hypothetical protein
MAPHRLPHLLEREGSQIDPFAPWLTHKKQVFHWQFGSRKIPFAQILPEQLRFFASVIGGKRTLVGLLVVLGFRRFRLGEAC